MDASRRSLTSFNYCKDFQDIFIRSRLPPRVPYFRNCQPTEASEYAVIDSTMHFQNERPQEPLPKVHN